jgi:hypothetical protein
MVTETPAMRLRDMAARWIDAPGYKRRYRQDVVKDLHCGVREVFTEAEVAQRLLDVAQVADGDPQGGGDVDARVAVAVLDLIHAQGLLAAIGVVSGYCMECERIWPCPTFQWANGDRDVNDAWEGSDD